jgi:hypothetical protein
MMSDQKFRLATAFLLCGLATPALAQQSSRTGVPSEGMSVGTIGPGRTPGVGVPTPAQSLERNINGERLPGGGDDSTINGVNGINGSPITGAPIAAPPRIR